jgi:hypothetical protein
MQPVNGKVHYRYRGDEQFDAQFDVEGVVKTNTQLYKDIISTLRYYRNNPITYQLELPEHIEFDDKVRRYERSFLKICDYVWEYCEGDKEKFIKMVTQLYEAYQKYSTVLQDALMRR